MRCLPAVSAWCDVDRGRVLTKARDLCSSVFVCVSARMNLLEYCFDPLAQISLSRSGASRVVMATYGFQEAEKERRERNASLLLVCLVVDRFARPTDRRPWQPPSGSTLAWGGTNYHSGD